MRGQLTFLAACLLSALVSNQGPSPVAVSANEAFPGWPTMFEGRTLARIELTQREARFYEAFPGRVARFTDGQREIIFRWVSEETHLMHPASTCFRGLGYEIEAREGVMGDSGRMWGAFRATREGVSFEVRELVYDETRSWSDVSAWYWSAALGRTTGPWWAVMVAE